MKGEGVCLDSNLSTLPSPSIASLKKKGVLRIEKIRYRAKYVVKNPRYFWNVINAGDKLGAVPRLVSGYLLSNNHCITALNNAFCRGLLGSCRLTVYRCLESSIL